jgi:hypothetical protein
MASPRRSGDIDRYLETLKRGFEQDERDLKPIKEQSLADANCDRHKIEEQADSAQDAISGAHDLGEQLPQKAVRDDPEQAGRKLLCGLVVVLTAAPVRQGSTFVSGSSTRGREARSRGPL